MTAMHTSAVSPVPQRSRLKIQRDILRLGLLIAAMAVGFVPTFQYIGSMIWFREYLGDFRIFWGIGSAPLGWVYGHYGFPYPPTALLLVRPFGLLPFWPALVLWGIAGAAAIGLATRKTISPIALSIGFVTAAGAGVLFGGQISLFVGALIIAGVNAASPPVRGVLLAAAAVIKPQSVLAAPFALIAERNKGAIGWAIATGCALLLLSLLLFGSDTWFRWATNLHKFPTYLTSRGIDLKDVGLYGLARSLGLPGWTYAIGIPFGAATSWLVFRKEAAPIDRYAAFAASSVLISPYTLVYDLAGLTFVCVAMLLDRKRSPLIWLAAALIVSSIFANLGIILLAAVLSYEAIERGPSQLYRQAYPI